MDNAIHLFNNWGLVNNVMLANNFFKTYLYALFSGSETGDIQLLSANCRIANVT